MKILLFDFVMAALLNYFIVFKRMPHFVHKGTIKKLISLIYLLFSLL